MKGYYSNWRRRRKIIFAVAMVLHVYILTYIREGYWIRYVMDIWVWKIGKTNPGQKKKKAERFLLFFFFCSILIHHYPFHHSYHHLVLKDYIEIL